MKDFLLDSDICVELIRGNDIVLERGKFRVRGECGNSRG